MALAIALAALGGAAVVLQNTINKRLASAWSLPDTVFLTGLVFFVCTALWFVGARFVGRDAGGDIGSWAFAQPWTWLGLLPGVLGFVIVAGLPAAIARSSAFLVIVVLIASQLVVSLLWDAAVEQQPLAWNRIVGVLLALAGAALASLPQDGAR